MTLAAASLALGRNQTYLQQYVDRGVPAVLGYRATARSSPECSGASLRNSATRPCPSESP